jgi:hypothetical protein
MFKTLKHRLKGRDLNLNVLDFCHLIFGFVSDVEIRISNFPNILIIIVKN